MWNIIVAITTVGYGDFYPESIWGQLILIFSNFIGFLIISLIVVSFTTLISFSNEEEKAYLIMQRKKLRKLYRVNFNAVHASYSIIQVKQLIHRTLEAVI